VKGASLPSLSDGHFELILSTFREQLELREESAILLQDFATQLSRFGILQESRFGVGNRDGFLGNDAEFPVTNLILSRFPRGEVKRTPNDLAAQRAVNVKGTLAVAMTTSLTRVTELAIQSGATSHLPRLLQQRVERVGERWLQPSV
jgi:hypothetical protein